MFGANDQLFPDIGHHKIKDNAPFLFVSHDKIISLSKDGITEITNLSGLPKIFVSAIRKTQRKLNKDNNLKE